MVYFIRLLYDMMCCRGKECKPKVQPCKEWGVKSIKKRREDEHGNIEFLVEWDGDWAETWEPQVNLDNAQDKIDAFLALGSRGAPQVPRRRNRTDGE